MVNKSKQKQKPKSID